METMSDREIAEFIKLFQNLQAPKEEPNGKEAGPFMSSEAEGLAEQLGDFLQKLHTEDMQGHLNNNTWLQQIDRKMKALEDTIVAVATGQAIVVCVFIFFAMLIVRGCGG
jgi:hypothetical protein